MVSTNPSSGKARSEPITAGRFQFISVQAPDDAKDPATRRLARSHAVKQALEKKRKLQQESTDNFRVIGLRDKPRRSASKRPRTGTFGASPFSLSADLLDPFQTLAVDSSRLQALLSNYKARLAPEPVFSVCEELAFQNFRSVFRTGLVDPALLNAVMLSLAVAVTGGSIDRECLGYQGQAISYIRERMSSLDEATSESTIGAILLLAGVEVCNLPSAFSFSVSFSGILTCDELTSGFQARLGVTSQVQLHMGAVQLLLNICLKKGICLTGGIKRAIFW
ncbi:hypothetical protein TruAng_010957 [Truncatella angustata]|nr:hypothetical protein TruAng_010957 [Truncatella angustata]